MEDKNSTFWGLILQPGKRYEQIVEKSFHVSMAALDISSGGDKTTVQVMINVDGQEFILCHLSKNRNPQQTLDLNFQGGDSLALYVEGQAPQPVHLTGFYNVLDDDDDLDGLEMSDMSDEEEVPELAPAKLGSAKKKAIEMAKKEAGKGDGEVAAKRKGSPVKESPQKKTKLQNAIQQAEDSDDDDDDDEDEEEEAEEEEDDEDDEDGDGEDEEVEEGFSDEDDEDDDDEDDEDDEDDDDDEEDEEDDEEEVDEPPIPLKKGKSPAGKKEQAQVAAKANGVAKAEETPKKKKTAASEQTQKTPVQQEKKTAQTPKSAKRTIGGGVMVEDIIVGNGPVAKRGRPVSVYYVGRLKQNNKQFDQTTGGPGFKFRLGGKEVIKGWDIGVEGMKVGGKRRITCPPHMAYGARGSPPVIPPNSALVFDVTLKNVH